MPDRALPSSAPASTTSRAPSPIEDYALLGDCQSAALVGRDGSIDWMTLPRFDSDACFAAILGDEENGFWRISPAGQVREVRRAYRDTSLTLETEITTDEGTIVLTDFMAIGETFPSLVRIVTCTRGRVDVTSELALRFEMGRTVPWVRHAENGIVAIAGPDLVRVGSTVAMHGEGLRTVATFTMKEGDRVPFVLAWRPSHEGMPELLDPEQALLACDQFWTTWSSRCVHGGPYKAMMRRSLATLKALTYLPTGGIVAAPTTSLPEQLGGVRNWDYRFCWVRDSTFTLYALLEAGHTDEARAWRDWLLRAAAGSPSQLQILYGIAGERRLPEIELPWLSGYHGSAPVRVGNAAADQTQLDVYGELMDTLYQSHKAGLDPSNGWEMQRSLVNHLEQRWEEPDHGIWEVRGPKRHFVHSKVMCWVAFDRAVKSIETWGLEGPLERWRTTRAAIHAQICAEGCHPDLGFVQHYGTEETDASLLLIPLVGFLPPEDPRVVQTVATVQKRLVRDQLVLRYLTDSGVDGLPGDEGAFLACSFWLVDALVLLGRHEEARARFEGLLALGNDVGLFAEEYDPRAKRMLGNFPQALTHVALVNSALNLSRALGPARERPVA